MSKLDVIDVVDMLEKKHNFTREDAKMLIDFQQSRVATKDDLNMLNVNLEKKIDKEVYSLEKKIDSVKSELKEEITKNSRSQLLWTFGMFVTFVSIMVGLIKL